MVPGGLKVQSKYLAVSKEIIGRIGIIMNKATVAPVRTLVMPPISKMLIEPLFSRLIQSDLTQNLMEVSELSFFFVTGSCAVMKRSEDMGKARQLVE